MVEQKGKHRGGVRRVVRGEIYVDKTRLKIKEVQRRKKLVVHGLIVPPYFKCLWYTNMSGGGIDFILREVGI